VVFSTVANNVTGLSVLENANFIDMSRELVNGGIDSILLGRGGPSEGELSLRLLEVNLR
jgi:hypothetical protein